MNKAKDEIAKFEWPPMMSAMNRHVRVLDKQFGPVQVASVELLGRIPQIPDSGLGDSTLVRTGLGTILLAQPPFASLFGGYYSGMFYPTLRPFEAICPAFISRVAQLSR